jgi:hypothetical protein
MAGVDQKTRVKFAINLICNNMHCLHAWRSRTSLLCIDLTVVLYLLGQMIECNEIDDLGNIL